MRGLARELADLMSMFILAVLDIQVRRPNKISSSSGLHRAPESVRGNKLGFDKLLKRQKDERE